ncbi:hypothetical protein MBLNU457_7354t2 [Dothideomycetes sp. NU457]
MDDVLAMTHVLTIAAGTITVNQNAPKEWTELADSMTRDMRRRRLPPSHHACYNILFYYDSTRQFDRGAQFWTWLSYQEDTYNSPNTYAAAIQLLAKQGKLQHETEALFAQALQRFPSSFVEYHFSPNAVLQDRGQASMIQDMPGHMQLLNAIIVARLLQGNSRDAYLGLDTALRLGPERLPLSFYACFIEERPVTEAYKVFQLAARSGSFAHHNATRTLMTKLRQAAAEEPMRCASLIRATVTVITQNVKLGATRPQAHALHEIIISVLSILESKTWVKLSSQQLRPLTDKLDEIVLSLIEVFGFLDCQPNIAAYNSMIWGLAGRGKRQDLLYRLLQDAEARGLKPTAVTHRAVMRACANAGDAELHAVAWRSLVQTLEGAGNQPRHSDWTLLSGTAVAAGNAEFARQQVKDLSHTLTESTSSFILQDLAGREERFHPWFEKQLSDAQLREIEAATELLDQIRADVAIFSAVARDSTSNSAGPSMEQIPLDLGRNQAQVQRDEKDRQRFKNVYNNLTSDTSSPAEGSASVQSASGVPFAELRFRNWQVINELLAEAEVYDDAYNEKINTAVSAGTTPPARKDVWLETTMSLLPEGSAGLSDYIQQPHESSSANQVPQSKWFPKSRLPAPIRRLRGMESDQV